MAIGVQENDVWHAADALLADGQQPTVERVRLKIGRGSPNTVGPHLKSWFRGLSERMNALPSAMLRPAADAAAPSERDREIAAALAAMPAAAGQTVLQFWEAALKVARDEWKGEAAEARDAIAHDRAVLEQQREDLVEEQARLAQRQEDLMEAFRSARDRAQEAQTALKAAQAQLEVGAQTSASQAAEIARIQALLQDVQSRHTSAVASLEERHAAHERRWLGEIDELRQAQKKLNEAAEVARKAAATKQSDLLSTIGDLKAEVQDQTLRATRAEMDVARLTEQLDRAEQSAVSNQEAWESRVSAAQEHAAAQITQLQQQLETKDRQIEMLARPGRGKPNSSDPKPPRKSASK